DRGPSHEVVALAFVLVVARLALLALHHRRGVEPRSSGDPRTKILVVVAGQALIVRQLLAVSHVTIVAVVLCVQRRGALGQRSRRASEELVATASPASTSTTSSPTSANARPTRRVMGATLPGT